MPISLIRNSNQQLWASGSLSQHPLFCKARILNSVLFEHTAEEEKKSLSSLDTAVFRSLALDPHQKHPTSYKTTLRQRHALVLLPKATVFRLFLMTRSKTFPTSIKRIVCPWERSAKDKQMQMSAITARVARTSWRLDGCCLREEHDYVYTEGCINVCYSNKPVLVNHNTHPIAQRQRQLITSPPLCAEI